MISLKLIIFSAILSFSYCQSNSVIEHGNMPIKIVVPKASIDESNIQKIQRNIKNDPSADKLKPIEPIFDLFKPLRDTLSQGSNEIEPNSVSRFEPNNSQVSNDSRETAPETSSGDLNDEFKQPHIAFFIVNSKLTSQEDSLPEDNNKIQNDLQDQPTGFRHLVFFRLFPSFFDNEIGPEVSEEPIEKTKAHLLGGPSDPDHGFKSIGDSLSSESSSEEDLRNNFIPPMHSSLLSFLNWRPGYDRNDAERPSIIVHTDADHDAFISSDDLDNDETGMKKKCNMMNFMRFKASVYYRSVIHLLFIGGLTVLFGLIICFSITICKKRKTYNYYPSKQGGMISIIESGTFDEKPPKEGASTDFNKIYPNSSPPSYDQLMVYPSNQKTIKKTSTRSTSSLIYSLAAAYRNRYTKLNPHENIENLAKSNTSLPHKEEIQKN